MLTIHVDKKCHIPLLLVIRKIDLSRLPFNSLLSRGEIARLARPTQMRSSVAAQTSQMLPENKQKPMDCPCELGRLDMLLCQV